ncbi:MAG: hypothetical protein HC824_04660 [Synechococcales cyanobacterium RM1_1_8]|nr:hypothetical protein [Synechococcales cyanobacterium RM1_1_8]
MAGLPHRFPPTAAPSPNAPVQVMAVADVRPDLSRDSALGAAYGPGFLPLFKSPALDAQPLDEQVQIELLFQLAGLDLMPLFHEVVGDVVYRVLSQAGERKILPIPEKINQRVWDDVQRLSAPIDPALLDWLEVPLLVPDLPGRRSHCLNLPGHPLHGLRARNLRSDRNTLLWLYQEAQENATAARPKGYTANLGDRFGFDSVIEAYGQLLECLDYCDRFKFVFHFSR